MKSKGSARKVFFRLQWQRMHRFERKTLPRFSRVVAVSEPDLAVMSGWVEPERIDIVDNGVDTEYFKPSGVKPKPHSIVFTGSLDWRPNVDAMLYFLNDMARHSAGLSGGNNCDRRPNPIGSATKRVSEIHGVTLIGKVDDVRPYMERAAVYVVPLRIGGGSRLKILEAMSMRKPVVSTTTGAEGLHVSIDRNILIADEPSSFAAIISRLFRDSQLCYRLGESGRALVEGHYEWQNL